MVCVQTVESSPRCEGYTDEDVTLSQLVSDLLSKVSQCVSDLLSNLWRQVCARNLVQIVPLPELTLRYSQQSAGLVSCMCAELDWSCRVGEFKDRNNRATEERGIIHQQELTNSWHCKVNPLSVFASKVFNKNLLIPKMALNANLVLEVTFNKLHVDLSIWDEFIDLL